MPAAHTDGDTIVFFRRSDVISTGRCSTRPRIRGSIPIGAAASRALSTRLNRVIEIAVAGENQEGGTVIVPGRGRLGDQTDVANYRDMVTIVRDRMRDLIGKAARSTR